ncbi:MAG: hypothetical protein KDC85_17125 [Saprospiraceae bacterium]|nr:hypothetical protein [Saprospiraceae bacterium]MCB9278947.1 hypothetical protein [Lewinellaceae bacterium]
MRTVIQLLAFCMVPACFYAQSPEKGHLMIGLLDVEPLDSTAEEGLQIAFFKEMMAPQFRREVYFNQAFSAEVYRDEDGNVLHREVYSRDTRLAYLFQYEPEGNYYFIDSTVMLHATEIRELDREGIEDVVMVGQGPDSVKTIFGFQCKRVELKDPGGFGPEKMIFYVTEALPSYGESIGDAMPLFSGFPMEVIMEVEGMRITAGPISFDPEIDDESVFSLNTEGFEKRSREETGLFSDDEEEEDMSDNEIEPGLGINLDLYRRMVEEGVIEYEEYALERLEEVNGSIDRLSLITKSESALVNRPPDSILYLLDQYGLLDQPFKAQMERIYQQDKNIDSHRFYYTLVFGALKQELDDPENRSQFVRNMVELGYRQKGASSLVDTLDFLAGKESFDDFMMKLEGFQEISFKDLVTNLEAAATELESMFRQVLKDDARTLKAEPVKSPEGNGIKIIVEDFQYFIPKDWLSYYEYEEEELPDIADTLNIYAFYEYQFAQILRQIGADLNLDMAFGPYLFEAMFDEFYFVDYQGVIADHPEFRIFNREWAFLKFPKKLSYDYYAQSPSITFPYSGSRANLVCLRVHSPYTLDENSGENYLRSEEKEKLLNYFSENKAAYSLSDQTFAEYANSVRSNLFNSPDQILAILPGFGLTLGDSGWESIDISPDRNTFKHLFGQLDHLLEGIFDATNFSAVKDFGFNYKVSFDFKGKHYEFKADPTFIETFMINKAQEVLIEHKMTNKKLYTVDTPSWGFGSAKDYYFLTEKQKKEIEELTGLVLEPLSE